MPSCHLTPWRRLNVHTVPSSLGSHDSARPGASSPSSPSVHEELEALGDEPVGAEVLHGDRVERRRPASGRRSRIVPPAWPAPVGAGCGRRARRAAVRRAGAEPRRTVVVVATAGGDHGADERHREADDRPSPDEVPPADLAPGVLPRSRSRCTGPTSRRARSKRFQSMGFPPPLGRSGDCGAPAAPNHSLAARVR